MSQIEKASRLLSYILRHKPEKLGIDLDKEGWASVDDIIRQTLLNGQIALTQSLIEVIVNTDDKGRYELSEDKDEIRAVQGHSSPLVDITYPSMVPPIRLYHGTASKNLESIKKHGLVPANRHYVHLSESIETATAVGKRHGEPTVIYVDCKKMLAADHKFYQAPNGVWLVDAVDKEFLLYSVTA